MTDWAPHLTAARVRTFWSKVSLPDSNGCMLWRGSIDGHGYGGISVGGKTRKAHQVSLVISVGLAESSLLEGAHSCRNRHCVAPAHLRWATRAENLADKLRDGTDQFGQRNARAVLTEAQVAEIRRRYAAGETLQKDLAREFGIARSAVGAIVTGVNWPHTIGDGSPVTTGPRLKKTCVNGHEFTPENTYVRVRRGGQQRECITCQRETQRRRRGLAKAAGSDS